MSDSTPTRLNTPTYLTVPEVAELLRLSTTTVYRLVEAKRIPHFRVASGLRFDRVEIDTWARSSHRPAV